MVAFWVTTLCKIVNLLQCVGQTCCHHIQGDWIRFWLPRRWKQHIFLNLENSCIILHSVVIYKTIISAMSAMEAWNVWTLMCSGTIGLWCITFWSYNVLSYIAVSIFEVNDRPESSTRYLCFRMNMHLYPMSLPKLGGLL
jgi:hypothetical protein